LLLVGLFFVIGLVAARMRSAALLAPPPAYAYVEKLSERQGTGEVQAD
jgi:hypothetical protein